MPIKSVKVQRLLTDMLGRVFKRGPKAKKKRKKNEYDDDWNFGEYCISSASSYLLSLLTIVMQNTVQYRLHCDRKALKKERQKNF